MKIKNSEFNSSSNKIIVDIIELTINTKNEVDTIIHANIYSKTKVEIITLIINEYKDILNTIIYDYYETLINYNSEKLEKYNLIQ